MIRFKRAAIISTGTEILQGLYMDSNARWLAEQVNRLGIEVVLILASPDDGSHVENALRFACSQADLVICTGGLGPTVDDVNRDVFARVFSAPLTEDARAVEMMFERFKARGRVMPTSNNVQALVPTGCTVFHNDWGTAPGYFLPPASERGVTSCCSDCALIALPGPPREMAPMFAKYAEAILAERSGGLGFVRTLTIHTVGRAESDVNEHTADLFSRNPDVTFTLLAKGYGVDARVTARATSQSQMDALLAEYRDLVSSRIGRDDIYGIDDDMLNVVVARQLTEQKRTICVAESCTGGLINKMLTDIPGSSDFLKHGFVTYSNEAKSRWLGVRPNSLKQFGAVSEKVAREMAEGARRAGEADIGLAVTGVAGPTGGTPDKPVGLIWVAVASDRATQAAQFRFLGDREGNRTLAATAALNLVRKTLLY